ncbi:FmdB family zinc ribbon protein [Microbacterium proteolyticum]|uniref:FmdB family zinc ribbon protein n=1 Tax=Microbacterium proteolyticum TaxID=1572644 RepID=UPI001FAB6EDA|nr:FmdB family zinc ribbon protein [Microbacterium proteolyticum]MCI9857054.1 FmdB family transcriptional regulator [Microbacterium proteolyticum]
MPTYSYACKQCGHRFDTVQSFTDAALTECPECGGEVRKQYGSIGVTFNGSGFYRTDSRASSSSSSSSASSGDSSSSTTSSKSETKASAPSSAS